MNIDELPQFCRHVVELWPGFPLKPELAGGYLERLREFSLDEARKALDAISDDSLSRRPYPGEVRKRAYELRRPGRTNAAECRCWQPTAAGPCRANHSLAFRERQETRDFATSVVLTNPTIDPNQYDGYRRDAVDTAKIIAARKQIEPIEGGLPW